MATETFRGRIGVTHEDSEPDWPETASPGNAPNILLILLDDTGFGNLGCYGSTIETPHMDALAENGLRYNNFHVTPLCSPTRASLLTGRNHHAVGISTITGFGDSGYPNQRGRITRHAANLAEMLSEEGFATFALGKWHLNPNPAGSAAGPYDDWPLQRGFDRFYGFLPGATPQFDPDLTCDNHPVAPPKTPEQGYHLTDDLVDHAIKFINDLKAIRPETPFFTYFATGAMHYPHQAPKAYIDKYRGRFDEGWDVLRERYFARQVELGIVPPGTRLPPSNPGVPRWETLGENERRFVCRLQEAWAGFLEHTDAQIGRLIEHLRAIGQLDNTVVILTADNGTSQNGGPYGVMHAQPGGMRNAANDGRTLGEKLGRPVPLEDFDAVQEKLDDIGGPNSNCDIPWGWSQVGNTPLRWYKQDTHGGGVQVPMIIRYPPGITDPGGIRDQFHYVTDIAPTILEIANVRPRSHYRGYDQMPIAGTSLAYTLDDAECPTRKPIQHFEMMGKRGLWCDGWKAVTRHEPGDDYDDDDWELYHLDEDFSEVVNLAAAQPNRLRRMIDLWWVEAGRHGVLPLDDRAGQRRPARHDSLTWRFVPPLSRIPRAQSPALGRRKWSVMAEVELRGKETEGVIYSQGSFRNGISLFIQDGSLCLAYRVLGNTTLRRAATELPTGRVNVGVVFEPGDGDTGRFTLVAQDRELDTIPMPDVTQIRSMRGAEVGHDRQAPMTHAYKPPFEFTGVIHSVDITVATGP